MENFNLVFSVVSLSKNYSIILKIKSLLNSVDLEIDKNINEFIIGEINDEIVACAGIDNNIIKCVAVDPAYQGENLTLKLINFVYQYAHEQGQTHLFLYTKPNNVDIFIHCGFYPLVEIQDMVVLMENTPIGISRYSKSLSEYQKPGLCGSIVMNANPFTLGHLYLAEKAAQELDWLYIFVVSEDASLFSTNVRYELVKQGVSHLNNVTVLLGSKYMISKATFPTYFLKDQDKIDASYLGIDLLLFRQFIAPSLLISRRYVGTEPHSQITNAYNQAMKYWLEQKVLANSNKINVIEIPRTTAFDDVISASRVRNLLLQKNYEAIKPLVPDTTWKYIKDHYHVN